MQMARDFPNETCEQFFVEKEKMFTINMKQMTLVSLMVHSLSLSLPLKCNLGSQSSNVELWYLLFYYEQRKFTTSILYYLLSFKVFKRPSSLP